MRSNDGVELKEQAPRMMRAPCGSVTLPPLGGGLLPLLRGCGGTNSNSYSTYHVRGLCHHCNCESWCGHLLLALVGGSDGQEGEPIEKYCFHMVARIR